MPTVRTIAEPPLSDSVTVHIPEEYRKYSLEIFIVPVVARDDVAAKPAWAGLCEDAVTKNLHGPHDMDAIRESIMSVKRLQAV